MELSTWTCYWYPSDYIYSCSNHFCSGSTIAAAVAKTALSNESGIVSAFIIIVGAILAFVIYFILGLIGGIIGTTIKERGIKKPIPKTNNEQ